MELVSARPSGTLNGSSVEAVRSRTAALLSGGKGQASDPDLQRAKDLVSLHYAVKIKHLNSKGEGGVEVDESLEDARYAVKVALQEMGKA
jgi:hypothetical protein